MTNWQEKLSQLSANQIISGVVAVVVIVLATLVLSGYFNGAPQEIGKINDSQISKDVQAGIQAGIAPYIATRQNTNTVSGTATQPKEIWDTVIPLVGQQKSPYDWNRTYGRPIYTWWGNKEFEMVDSNEAKGIATFDDFNSSFSAMLAGLKDMRKSENATSIEAYLGPREQILVYNKHLLVYQDMVQPG